MTTEERLAATLECPVEIRRISIGPYQINYAVAGSGPNLLLLHGANFGWGVWYPNIPEFAKQYKVYALDLPGAGRSSRIDYATMDPYRDLLSIVEEFIDKLNLHDIAVIGCSIGGWLALQLALLHPEKINKLVLENTVGVADYMSRSDKVIGFYPLAALVAKIVIRPGTKNVEKFLRGIFYNKKIALRPEFLEYFQETMMTSHNLLFISRLTALHKALLLEDQLHVIRQKTLILWGEKDTIIPLRRNQKNFSLIPNVTVRIISDAGHIPSLEMPVEFNNLAMQFLQ